MPTKKKTSRVSAAKKSVPKKSSSKKSTKTKSKVGSVMREYKEGKLHSRSARGPVVKSRKQAIAIALHEAGVSKKQIQKKSANK